MAESPTSTIAARRKDERKIWRTGFLTSLLIHLLVFTFWRGTTIPLSPFAAAGPRAHDSFAASGSAMQVVNVAPAVAVTPVMPKPEIAPVEVEVEPMQVEPTPVIVAMDVGVGTGTAGPGTTQGPGITDGRGAGDGGTGEEGLFRLVPPTPRGMIIPPSNQRLKGREVEVWVFVDARGRVVADSTRLEPPTPDRDFNRLLIREAAEWIFRPATQGGQPVATWFPYRITM